MRWDQRFQFAGYYAAKCKDFFRNVGLDIELKSALKTKTVILSSITEVSEDWTDFGIGATDLLLARDQGMPLVVLATIFHRSATGFFLKVTTEIDSLPDLVSFRLARSVNSLIGLDFQVMLKTEGIDPNTPCSQLIFMRSKLVSGEVL